MAKVEVQGVVERIHTRGGGFNLRESWPRRDGSGESSRFWSVFLPDRTPAQVVVGDRVRVVGALRVEVSKRDPRYVDHTVSSAGVEIIQENGPRSWGPPADEPPAPTDADAPPADGWNVAPIPGDDQQW
ncbi:hypothetical protein QE418_003422 [Microbacterium testaceum]|uniref:hypothetical protein n=1 Tax=Microbacterium TaxID=33882 RepID=UPI002783177D|nr:MULTISPECIES: hypothetical protein [Microbacterium]MDQ1113974.1 hypothetical protein [Microbacterium testaceum]MDR6098920.1 hypothetical protein [Microbacterium sp. SORGH_AS_0454]